MGARESSSQIQECCQARASSTRELPVVGLLRLGEHGSNRMILSEIKVSCGLELY